MDMMHKLKNWLNATTWGTCRVCYIPLTGRYDNRNKMLCEEHEVEQIINKAKEKGWLQ